MQLDYLILAIAAMILLGVHFFLVKIVSQNVAGINLAFFAQLLIVPVVLFFICFTNGSLLPKINIYLGYTFLISFILAIGVITLYLALQKGPVSIVMPIYTLNVIITAILGILILEETVNIQKILGIILAITAIILLSRR